MINCYNFIDSHVHVWSNGIQPFPLDSNPPDELAMCQISHLQNEMNQAGVTGALIVQPINHKFDHSYVASVLSERIKGMALLDPNANNEYLPKLKSLGFIGVRFNPYLFDNSIMACESGEKLYKQAGELNMPVGFMCFKGLNQHYNDIQKLINLYPQTQIIIDHWGFIYQDGKYIEESWNQLLSLASYSNVYIKLSAPFRNSNDGYSYNDLEKRLEILINKFGTNRLMLGSDYPFILQKEGYKKSWECWNPNNNDSFGKILSKLNNDDLYNIQRGTVESLFGKWPDTICPLPSSS